MKYVDKIAVALGKMPTLPDFDVRGEIGNAPPITHIAAAQMNAKMMFLIGSLKNRK